MQQSVCFRTEVTDGVKNFEEWQLSFSAKFSCQQQVEGASHLGSEWWDGTGGAGGVDVNKVHMAPSRELKNKTMPKLGVKSSLFRFTWSDSDGSCSLMGEKKYQIIASVETSVKCDG